MMKTIFTVLILTLTCAVAGATDAGHGHGIEIPKKEIFWQFFNLAILFSGLIYFLRQPIKEYFRTRREGYVSAAKKSQAAREEAEMQFLDIKHKLEHLESTRDESLSRAQAEAADMRKSLLQEAQKMAERVRHEAELTAQLEIQKAKQELHERFVREAIGAARTVLSKDIGQQDQQKLQADFVRQVQAVNP